MPEMRSKFRRAFRAFHEKMSHTASYTIIYLDRLIELLEDETNARMAMVEKGVRDLLDSGWKPTAQESIKTVYLKMFEVRDHAQDPTSDLYALAEQGNELIGQPNPTGPQAPRLRLGRIQVDAYDASVARMEAHVVKEEPHPGPVFHGPTQYVVGDGNTAHFTNISGNIDARSIHHAVTTVREHIGEFAEEDRDDVQAHLATVEDELKKPEPNAGRLKASWRAVQKLVGAGASAALSAAIDSVVKNAMSR